MGSKISEEIIHVLSQHPRGWQSFLPHKPREAVATFNLAVPGSPAGAETKTQSCQVAFTVSFSGVWRSKSGLTRKDERRPLETAQSYLLKEAAEIIKSNFPQSSTRALNKARRRRATQIPLSAETHARSYFQKMGRSPGGSKAHSQRETQAFCFVSFIQISSDASTFLQKGGCQRWKVDRENSTTII